MKSKQLIKTILIVSLIIIFSLYYNVKELRKGIRNYKTSNAIDEITLYEQRFGKLKELLPSHGSVGYISGKVDDPIEDTKIFYLTQYALAPVIVVRGKNHQLIVGNFHNTNVSVEICMKDGLILVKDFGNGVLLFKRKDNK